MPETFIELVPRSRNALCEQMQCLASSDIPFDGYNFPELRRTGSTFLSPEEMMTMRTQGEIDPGKQLVLHLRTRERTAQQTIERMRLAERSGIQTALLITGDAFEETEVSPTATHHVLHSLEGNKPDIQIGIGADIYHPNWGRWSDKEANLRNGTVDSVFTQPIFRPQVLSVVRQHTEDFLERDHVFAGVTWVQNAKSRQYWNERNGVPLEHLPKGNCEETIRSNSLSQATDVLRQAQIDGHSVYIMLMRGTVKELEQIFERSENIQEY